MEVLKDTKIRVTIGIAIAFIIFVIGTTSEYTSSQNKIEERLCNLEDKMTDVASAVNDLQANKHTNDLIITEIKVKLTSIESILQEIKSKQ